MSADKLEAPVKAGEVALKGYLKKFKTMKKKYFILRTESEEASARLEYYDSEKKYRNSQPPKRTISLKTCFNINRRRDTKQKFVIALYTKDDCFCVVLETEEELDRWLKTLLTLQNGEDVVDGEPPKPTFEHVWKVLLQEKGLGDSKNLAGPYHVCLTDQTLSLVKIERCSEDSEEKPETLEIPLMYIRSCGVTGSFVFIELGRQAVTGAGALWMLTEDGNIAKNMNSVIFSAFSLKQRDQVGSDGPRKRSASATESSKPSLFLQKRHTHGGSKPLVPPGYSEASTLHPHKSCQDGGVSEVVEHTYAVPVSSSLAQSAHSRGSLIHYVHTRPPSQRRHSVSAMSSSSVAGHHQRTTSPPAPVSHQRTKSCPVTESSLPCPSDTILSDLTRPSSQPCESDRRGSASGRKCTSSGKSVGTRDRSDSMPSRERDRHTSEGASSTTSKGATQVPARPLSLHGRGLSYSPPMASGPCSTDSAGSSLSINETDDLVPPTVATSPRYGHSSTPDEPAIMEEILDDYGPWPHETADDDRHGTDWPPSSLSLPIHPSVPGAHRKVSAPASLKSGSPLHSYEMMSPCDYMPMSPAYPRGGAASAMASVSHSRGSSYAEETPDGYVPMAPNHTDDGYVDMDPIPGHRLHGEDGHPSDMSPGSSCSVTSGTPSTDMRFSEYHLEKVSSYFTPSEDDEVSSTGRPARTYSFGSQPETLRRQGCKAEPAAVQSEAGRVRAFSVGSKFNRPRHLAKETHKLPVRGHVAQNTGAKSSSAPLLSSSWSGTSRHAQAVLDPMADLMEIDFTDHKKRGSRSKVAPVSETLNLDLKNSSHAQITSSADSGYMDMSSKSPSGAYPISKCGFYGENMAISPPRTLAGSPRNPALFGKSPPRCSPLVGDMANKLLFSPPGVCMEPKNSRLSKPAIISSSALKTIGEKPDIKPQKFPTTSSANLNIFALPNKPFAPGNSPRNSAAFDATEEYMDMRPKSNTARKFSRANSDKEMYRAVPGAIEGYVEMSWGGSAAKLTRKSSGENFSSRDDYMTMSASKSVCSQPIAIRSPAIASPVGRKNSVTTPPKVPPNYLACGSNYSGLTGGSSPLSSMRRNPRRKIRKKHERRGSKENVTTPTGSSTIFPLSLNSPMSPKKPFTKSHSESLTPTNSRSPEVSPLEENPYTEMCLKDEDSPHAEMTPGVELEDRPYSEIFGAEGREGSEGKEWAESSASGLSVPLSRVLRISSKGNSPTSHDYVNFAPGSSRPEETLPKPPFSPVTDDFGDYALMRPGTHVERKVSAPALGSYLGRLPGKLHEVPHESNSVAARATASANSDPKPMIAQIVGCSPSMSSPLPHKPRVPSGARSKDNSTEDKTEHSNVSRQMSASSTSSVETNGLKPGVSRQVSTSSSSSAEVASLKEAVTYASLDLAPSSSEGEVLRAQSSGSSPSPHPPGADTFTYAEIDFEKSESLKAPQCYNKKIRH